MTRKKQTQETNTQELLEKQLELLKKLVEKHKEQQKTLNNLLEITTTTLNTLTDQTTTLQEIQDKLDKISKSLYWHRQTIERNTSTTSRKGTTYTTSRNYRTRRW